MKISVAPISCSISGVWRCESSPYGLAFESMFVNTFVSVGARPAPVIPVSVLTTMPVDSTRPAATSGRKRQRRCGDVASRRGDEPCSLQLGSMEFGQSEHRLLRAGRAACARSRRTSGRRRDPGVGTPPTGRRRSRRCRPATERAPSTPRGAARGTPGRDRGPPPGRTRRTRGSGRPPPTTGTGPQRAVPPSSRRWPRPPRGPDAGRRDAATRRRCSRTPRRFLPLTPSPAIA